MINKGLCHLRAFDTPSFSFRKFILLENKLNINTYFYEQRYF
jgi:hypothetical protein